MIDHGKGPWGVARQGEDLWPFMVRGGILVAGVLSSWGLALTALHLI